MAARALAEKTGDGSAPRSPRPWAAAGSSPAS